MSGVLLLVAAAFLGACSNEKTGQAQAKTQAARDGVPVTIDTAVSKSVPIQIKAIGTVQAYASVTLKSQLDGEVARIHFAEGQAVKKGALLFTLDRRPLEAMLNQAEANLARDMAQLENARSQSRRYKGLIDEGAISKELYDQVSTNATALEATIEADKAAIASTRASIRAAQATVENGKAVIRADQASVENARVQLSYTTIRAPMDARTGNLLVRAGSAVKARDDTAQMVILNQIHPIYVSFSIPEQYLRDIKKFLAAGTLRVQASSRGQDDSPASGELSFVNNTVDPGTGMIQLKATFSNRESALWPGQFVNVVLTLTVEPDRVVIPSQAIQTGQQGQYVYVVRSDSTVESRPVTAGRRIGGETVIEKGVSPGDKVVTDGHLRIVSGTRVQVKNAATAASGQVQ